MGRGGRGRCLTAETHRIQVRLLDSNGARVTQARLIERYATASAAHYARAQQALTTELDLIERKGLSGFFLIYADIMQLASDVADEVRGASAVRREAHLPAGRGRGSSVSSVVCYLLGMSHIDPLAHDLERLERRDA